jgi:putative chitinase
LNIDDLIDIAPYAKNSKYDIESLCKYIDEIFSIQKNYFRDLSTNKRRASFLSQCAYESTHFCRFSENLNYSQRGLLLVFPKYFNTERAKEYARNPQKIANRVYANRLGNGSESSGDGWKYRGRGMIQLTGRYHYRSCSEFLGEDLLSNPQFLETPEGAVKSAYWFWYNNPSLNIYSEQDNVKEVTRIVNGGLRGISERVNLYKNALRVLSRNA